jgi:hypothetical protein
MKRQRIIIVGAGACIGTICKTLASNGLKDDDYIIVTPDDIDKIKEETMQTRQLTTEPILYTAPPRIEDTYVPTKQEIENYHPFSKFIGKNKGKKGRGRW